MVLDESIYRERYDARSRLATFELGLVVAALTNSVTVLSSNSIGSMIVPNGKVSAKMKYMYQMQVILLL